MYRPRTISGHVSGLAAFVAQSASVCGVRTLGFDVPFAQAFEALEGSSLQCLYPGCLQCLYPVPPTLSLLATTSWFATAKRHLIHVVPRTLPVVLIGPILTWSGAHPPT